MGHRSDSVEVSWYLTESNPAVKILICSCWRHLQHVMYIDLLSGHEFSYERRTIKNEAKKCILFLSQHHTHSRCTQGNKQCVACKLIRDMKKSKVPWLSYRARLLRFLPTPLHISLAPVQIKPAMRMSLGDEVVASHVISGGCLQNSSKTTISAKPYGAFVTLKKHETVGILTELIEVTNALQHDHFDCV